MTLKEFAIALNGTEYGYDPFTKGALDTAKKNGYVIAYGASDDLIEFDGAYTEEAGGVYDGGEISFDIDGTSDDGKEHRNKILAYWCGQINGEQVREYKAVWEYETEIPHESFDMYEDGELFCRGIVFKLGDMR